MMTSAGCMSILTRTGKFGERETFKPLYPGTCEYYILIHDGIRDMIHPSQPEPVWDIPPSCILPPVLIIWAFDIPLTIVADTICLPYDGYIAIKERRREAEPTPADDSLKAVLKE